jgi:thiol:disulfide interchange protein DsbC
MIMNLNIIIFFMATAMLSCGVSASAADIDISKGITIGNGPKTVVEFTDPDCPFCRKASKYFEGRPDVTRHIFFYPLPSHPRAKEKVRFILSMPDKGKAYHDVMSGRMDTAPQLTSTPEGIKLQEEQREIAKGHKVDSTPTFMINGRIIVGFDVKKIEDALGPKP